MDPRPTSYELQELCAQAQVTPRTVRYYVQQGLLPAPDPQGPLTRYGQGHLDRLRLIRQLQTEHQPLAVIRKRLAQLGDADVHRLVTTSPPAKPPSSAVDYVRSVLGGNAASARVSPRAPLAEPPAAPSSRSRSQWERIPLSPDVELHVRRPLTREANRRVEKLLDLARRMLEEE